MTEQEQLRAETKKFKQTDKLIKSVMDLEKRLTKDAKEAEKNKGFSWKRGIKESAGKIGERVRDAFSIKSLASLAGIQEGGMIGDLLAARHESKREARIASKENVVAARKSAAGFSKFGTEAKEMRARGASENEIIERAVKLYQERLDIEKKIKAIEDERAEGREFDKNFDANKYKADDYAALNKKLEGLTVTKQAEPLMEPGDLLKKKIPGIKPSQDPIKDTIREIRDFMVKSMDLESKVVTETEKQTGPLPAGHRRELISGMKAGMDEDLLAIGKEQLEALHQIVKNSEMTEEEKLESMNKVSAAPIKEARKEQATGAGSFLDKAMNMLGSFKGVGEVVNVVKNLAGLVSSFLSVAGPILAVVGAGAAGVYLGGKLKDSIDSGITGMTGGKSQSLGDAVYSGVDSVKGWFGADDSAKMKKAEAKSMAELVVRKVQSGQPVSKTTLATLEANKKYLEPDLRSQVDAATRDAIIASPKSVVQPALQKPEITPRESQTAELEATLSKNETLVEEMKTAERTVAPSAAIVNAPTINNTTKEVRISPPVRNLDSTFNDRLGLSF